MYIIPQTSDRKPPPGFHEKSFDNAFNFTCIIVCVENKRDVETFVKNSVKYKFLF